MKRPPPLLDPLAHYIVCPVCGARGLLWPLRATDGAPARVIVGHRFISPCPDCGRTHPTTYCVPGQVPDALLAGLRRG